MSWWGESAGEEKVGRIGDGGVRARRCEVGEDDDVRVDGGDHENSDFVIESGDDYVT